MRTLRVVTLVALGLLVADLAGFVVGYSTCGGGDSGGCGSAHEWFNGVTAYLGIALVVAAAILVLMLLSCALARRRS